jgi:hypothetical protein
MVELLAVLLHIRFRVRIFGCVFMVFFSTSMQILESFHILSTICSHPTIKHYVTHAAEKAQLNNPVFIRGLWSRGKSTELL